MSLKDNFVRSRNHGERFIEILAEFLRSACASGIVSCDLTASGECMSGVFKTDDVVALPRMNSDRCRVELAQSLFYVDSVFRIDGARIFKHPFRSVHDISFRRLK